MEQQPADRWWEATITGGVMLFVGLMLTFSTVGQVVDGTVTVGTLLFALAALAFFSAGVAVTPALRQRLARRHALSAFGRAQTVDRRVIEADEECDERCVVCDDEIDRGVVRRFRDEFVVAGVPVFTDSVGYNYYCLECVADERGRPVETDSRDSATKERETTEQVAEAERH